MPPFFMSDFSDLIATADHAVLQEFGDVLRWTKTDTSTADLKGIIDLEVEFYGPEGEIAYLGKAVTVYASEMPSHQFGETLRALDSNGNPTGPTYRLQKTVSNDGSLMTIEIIT